MIMATQIPQTPKNRLEEILCDADLDYLGSDEYGIISAQLFKELNHQTPLSDWDWLNIQIRFLESHHYFTTTAINSRKQKKEKILNALKAIRNKKKPE